MCGIVGLIDHQSTAAERCFQALKTLEYRGYDSWGVAWINDQHQLQVEKHVGKIGQTILKSQPAQIAVGHTRWATHGGVTKINAHPHLDCTRRFAVVHNGIVENFSQLRKDLLERKHKLISETDTELIAHLLEEQMKKKDLVEAIKEVFKILEGRNGVVILDTQNRELVAVQNGSPLVVGRGKHGVMIASDAVALVGFADQSHQLEDQELVHITSRDDVNLYTLANGQQLEIDWKKLAISAEMIDQGDYPNFMIKEISEQPALIAKNAQLYWQSLHQLSAKFSTYQQLHLVGAGSSFNSALAATYMLAEVGRSAKVYAGGEIANFLPLVTDRDAIGYISQSGETADIVELAEIATQRKLATFSIVNRPQSTLDRLTDQSIQLQVGIEQCVLATKSFTGNLLVFYILSKVLAKLNQQESLKFVPELTNNLQKIISAPYREKYLHQIAQRLSKHQHIYIIGKGIYYPLALEAALKIKEVNYIHTEGFVASELKHGMIALIEAGTPCIVFSGDPRDKFAVENSAMEVKSRGGWVIGVSQQPSEVFEDWIPIYSQGDEAIFDVTVATQLLAYEIAILLGRDPDKPRNLAKSVTVK